MAGVQASRGAPATANTAAAAAATEPTAGGAKARKPKKTTEGLVGAGTPSEDFIATAEIRSLERQPYW